MSEDTAITPPPLKTLFIPASKDVGLHLGRTNENEKQPSIGELWVPPMHLLMFPHEEQGWEDLCKAIKATYGETVEVDKRKMGADFSGSYWIWCNEEARISDLRPQPNPMATSLTGSSYPILGDALLLSINGQGDHVDIEDGVFESLKGIAVNMREILEKCAEGTSFSDISAEDIS